MAATHVGCQEVGGGRAVGNSGVQRMIDGNAADAQDGRPQVIAPSSGDRIQDRISIPRPRKCNCELLRMCFKALRLFGKMT